MNTRADEALIEQINALPPERRSQVVDYVRFLTAEECRRQAGAALAEMWAKTPKEELTLEIEQMIVQEVRAVRAERRAKRKAEQDASGSADREINRTWSI